jgi:hypothetical protein
MESCAPGANATTASATRTNSSVVKKSTNSEAMVIATANDPSAAPRKRSRVRGSVLEKRAPVTAPMPITAALATHHGSAAESKPPPCRMPDPSMAPNIKPPGNRMRHTSSAATVDTTTSTASSTGESVPEPS